MSVAELPVPMGSGGPPERVPPQDVAAEMSVLGAMMLSKDAIADVVENLREGDFYRPSHQTIYAAVIDLYGRGEPADAITVAAELTRAGELARVGGAAYLHTLVAGVPTAANAGYYARIVGERAILRRLVEAGTRIVQIAQTGDGEVDDIVDRAQAEVYDVTERRSSEDYQPLSTIMGDALAEIEAIGNRGGAMVGVPTGFTDLDALTNGLHPGQLVVLAARPGDRQGARARHAAADPGGVDHDGRGARRRPRPRRRRPTDPRDRRHRRHGRSTVLPPGAQRRDGDRRRCRSHVADADAGGAPPSSGSIVRLAGLEIRTTAEIAKNREVRTAGPSGTTTASRRPRRWSCPPRQLPLPPYTLGVWLGDGTVGVAA